MYIAVGLFIYLVCVETAMATLVFHDHFMSKHQMFSSEFRKVCLGKCIKQDGTDKSVKFLSRPLSKTATKDNIRPFPIFHDSEC